MDDALATNGPFYSGRYTILPSVCSTFAKTIPSVLYVAPSSAISGHLSMEEENVPVAAVPAEENGVEEATERLDALQTDADDGKDNGPPLSFLALPNNPFSLESALAAFSLVVLIGDRWTFPACCI